MKILMNVHLADIDGQGKWEWLIYHLMKKNVVHVVLTAVS